MLLPSGDENHALRGNLSGGVLITLRIKVVVWISVDTLLFLGRCWAFPGRESASTCISLLRG